MHVSGAMPSGAGARPSADFPGSAFHEVEAGGGIIIISLKKNDENATCTSGPVWAGARRQRGEAAPQLSAQIPGVARAAAGGQGRCSRGSPKTHQPHEELGDSRPQMVPRGAAAHTLPRWFPGPRNPR